MSFNRLTAIKLKKSFAGLTNLDLSGNRIQGLGFLDYCPNLQTLNLSENPLDDLMAIFELSQLRSLYLWHTGIGSLEGIGRLKKLKELGVADNRLEDVSEVVQLSGLDLLFLGGNHKIPQSQLESLRKNRTGDLRGPQWKKLTDGTI